MDRWIRAIVPIVIFSGTTGNDTLTSGPPSLQSHPRPGRLIRPLPAESASQPAYPWGDLGVRVGSIRQSGDGKHLEVFHSQTVQRSNPSSRPLFQGKLEFDIVSLKVQIRWSNDHRPRRPRIASNHYWKRSVAILLVRGLLHSQLYDWLYSKWTSGQEGARSLSPSSIGLSIDNLGQSPG